MRRKQVHTAEMRENMQWSTTVQDYYPVSPEPRWGFGKATHPAITQVLERSRATYEACLDDLEGHQEALAVVPYDPSANASHPFWNNIWFSCLDAASLVSFLLTRSPKHYFEIGSGHSTLFARHAIEWGRLATTITSIDPKPRAEIDAICDRTIRTPLEDSRIEIFNELLPGDILFFDGSHRVFTNSDVTALFFDILPSLRPGVLVHLHDIFWPADYPAAWNGRLYSEQYLLGSMLLCGAPLFRVILPNYFTSTDARLGERVRGIFNANPEHRIPFVYPNDAQIPGVSFWMETI
jgi:hypothetical protein